MKEEGEYALCVGNDIMEIWDIEIVQRLRRKGSQGRKKLSNWIKVSGKNFMGSEWINICLDGKSSMLTIGAFFIYLKSKVGQFLHVLLFDR